MGVGMTDRKNPKRAASSESKYSLMEFMKDFPDDEACLHQGPSAANPDIVADGSRDDVADEHSREGLTIAKAEGSRLIIEGTVIVDINEAKTLSTVGDAVALADSIGLFLLQVRGEPAGSRNLGGRMPSPPVTIGTAGTPTIVREPDADHRYQNAANLRGAGLRGPVLVLPLRTCRR